jgi:hypothetical protein
MGRVVLRLSIVNACESSLIVQLVVAGIASWHRAKVAKVHDCTRTTEESMPRTYRLAKALFTLLATVSAAGLVAAQTAGAPDDPGKPRVVASHANRAAVARAMEVAMAPGEGQKRLEPMIGTFSVRIRIWVDPSKPPIESQATSVNGWVLGHRYIQSMLSGHTLGEPFNGIGYIGYDNVGKTYQVAWMDDASTAMTLYQGAFAGAGKTVKLKATVSNAVTGKPTPVEMRMTLAENGDHVTELWGQGSGGKMFKMMELQNTRTKP